MNNTNSHKHHINSMKSLDEFGLENCKLILIAECPCQTESISKRKKVDILKVIRTVSTDALLVGLEWKIAAAQESITFNSKKTQRILKNTQKITNSIMRTKQQHHENKKQSIRTLEKYRLKKCKEFNVQRRKQRCNETNTKRNIQKR